MNIAIIILAIALVAVAGLCIVLLSQMKRGTSGVADTQALLEAERRAAEERARRFDEMQRLYIEDAKRNSEYQMQQMQRLEQQHREQIERLERQHREQQQRLEEQYRDQAQLYARQHEEQTQRSSLEFDAMARKALERQSEALSHYNSEQLNALLDPMRQKLEEFNRAVNDSYVKENAARQSLNDQIERLMTFNNRIGEEARNLAKALKGDRKVQGDWGETVLETLLEQAGLQRGINFETQVTSDDSGKALRDEDGRHVRPDVVVSLPGDRRIIIDSKVSLTAYIDLVSAETDVEQSMAQRRLVESVKNHINELAGSKYQKIVKNSAEHILMFMPNEGAYIAAVQADPKLWDYAFARNVVIVAPTHLFSVMQLISQLWRQEDQNRNAAEIAKLGGLIHDKVVTFLTDFESISKHIQSAETSYEKCLRHLTGGGTSIVARTERMKNLGAKAGKHISQSMLDAAQLNADLELEAPALDAE